jgi:phage major head subunit gpT-like protein
MQITPAALRALNTAFSALYQEAFDASTPFWDRIATLVPSTTKSNTYGWMLKIPRMREWIGERIAQNLAAQAYAIVNKSYELTVEVDRDDIEDDNLGVYRPVVSEVGAQAARWADDLLVALLQNGDDAAFPCYDGKAFFADDHPVDPTGKVSGTIDNLFAGTALDATNYATVRAAMMGYKGADGKPLGVRPNLLVVPPQLEVTALKIINADLTNSGDTNVLKGTAQVLVIPELANEGTVWYLLDTTKAIKPFVFQQRRAPEFVSKDSLTDDNVFWKKKFIYGADSRGNAGYTLPFLAARAAQ